MPQQSRQPCRSEDDVSSSWSRPPNFLSGVVRRNATTILADTLYCDGNNESHTHLMPTYRPSADSRGCDGSAPASACGAADVATLNRDGNRAHSHLPPSSQ